MKSPLLVCVPVAALCSFLVALSTGVEVASTASVPSARDCLLEWNRQPSAPNRLRLVSSGPWPAARLLPGQAVAAGRSQPSTATPVPACLLTLSKQGRLQIVTGAWRAGHVRRWVFGPVGRIAGAPRYGNVRVLPDGRVTKISRR